MTLLSWHSGRLARVARSSAAAEIQAACDADDESLYCRLALSAILFGQFALKDYASAAATIPAAHVIDARCVYDALARSESSTLGLRDKKSGLEALSLKQSVSSSRTALRWTHSKAMVADVMTKDSPESQAPDFA